MFRKLTHCFSKNPLNILFDLGRVEKAYTTHIGRANYEKNRYLLNHHNKKFDFNFNNHFDKDNCIIEDRNSDNQWSVVAWLAVISSVLLYLLMNNKVQAEEKEVENDVENKKLRTVTSENFPEVMVLLAANDPAITSLEISFTLSEKQLEALSLAIQENTELGYIAWHEEQFSDAQKLIEARLIENNKCYRYHPTDYIHVLLSMHAYIDSEINDSVTLDPKLDDYLKNWKVEKVFSEKANGYYSAVYVNEKTHQVVLAVRGTEGGVMGVLTDACKQNSDWKTNLNEILVGNIVVEQQARNFEATCEAIKTAKEKGYKLSIAGHSLGAWLAELSAFYCHAYFDYPDVKAVTFDSPGSLPMMEKLSPNIKDRDTDIDLNDIKITTYLSIPNPVNSCNRHVGKVYKIGTKMEWGDWINNEVPDWVKNLIGKDKIQGVLSFEGHFLTGILEIFDPETGKPRDCQRMADWPRMKYTGAAKNFASEGSTVIKGILDKTNLPSIAKTGLRYGIDYLVSDTTLMTMVGFLINLHQVDQEQYCAYFQYVDAKGNKKDKEARKKIAYNNQFALIAKAKYRETDDINILKLEKGSIDDYLYELNKSKDNLDDLKKLPDIVKGQFRELLTTFTINQNKANKYILVPKSGYDVETIRESMQRLMSVIPKNILDSVQNRVINEYTTNIIMVENAKIQDARVTRIPENLPLAPNNYIEIEGKSKELEECLKTKKIALVTGLGGLGKSTFAAEYGRDCNQHGWQIRWLIGTQIDQEFLKLAKDLNIKTRGLNSEEVRDLVYGNFNKLEQKQILLIFDNVLEGEKLKSYLMNIPNKVKVVITSRNGNLLQDIGIKPININGFSKDEAVFYVKGVLGKSEHEAQELVATVTESPFRLSKAVAYLKQHNLKSISEFINEYKEIKAGKKQDEEIYPEVEMLFRDLKKKSLESWQLLKYLAYLDIEGVPLLLIDGLMEELSSANLQECVNVLEQLSLMSVVDKGNKKTLKVNHAIVQNETKKALIEEDSEEPAKILHNIICKLEKIFPAIDRNETDFAEAAQWLNHAKMLLNEAKDRNLPFVDRKNLIVKLRDYYFAIRSNYNEVINYSKELLNYQKSIYKESHSDVVVTLNVIGLAYLELGPEKDTRTGIEYLKQALDQAQELYPENNSVVAMLMNNLGSAYLELEEDIQKSLEYLIMSQKIYEKIFENSFQEMLSLNLTGTYNHYDFLEGTMVLAMIGNAYQKLGGKQNLKTGLDYQILALKIQQKFLFEEHLVIVKSLNNVGIAYLNLGGENNILQAINFFSEGLQINQELYLDNQIQTSSFYNHLAISYFTLNGEKNIRKGIECVEKSLGICKELPFDDLESMLLFNLGIMYVALGGEDNIRTGLKYSTDSLEINKILYSDHSKYTALSLYAIGMAHKELGGKENIKKGLNYLISSLKKLDKSKPSIWQAKILNNLGLAHLTLSGVTHMQEGLKYSKESLAIMQKLIGEEYHQQSAQALYSISVAYRQLGGDNIQEGFQCARKSLVMLQNLYPSSHPNVAMAFNNLGAYYQILGDTNKSLELKKQAYSIYLATFGKDYKKTNEIKADIEFQEPNFFKDLKNIQNLNCLSGNPVGFDCRMPIFYRETEDDASIAIKEKIQKSVLNDIAKSVDKYGWTAEYYRGVVAYGVKGYLNDKYLKAKLLELGKEDDSVEIAQMYSFEAMNLGVMKSKAQKRSYAVVEEFTRANSELVKKVAEKHPEFFVDGSIVKACVNSMPDDKLFGAHISQNVRYMGMEESKSYE